MVLGMQTLGFRNQKLSNWPPDGLTFQNRVTEFDSSPVSPVMNDFKAMIWK